jgi:hypothetical protein
VDRGVADAHVAVAGEPRQVRQEHLVELAPAGRAVDRLQRAALGRVAQEVEEPLAFAQVREPAQRLDDERGVAQPAVAVVPGARRAEGLGDAGRGAAAITAPVSA